MKAEEFDRKFDNEEDITGYLDLQNARRINQKTRRVNIDFPSWVVDGLDKQARCLGITRQALVKVWIAEKLGQTP